MTQIKSANGMRRRVAHISCVHTPFDTRILYKECRSLAKAGYDVFFIVPAGQAKQVVEAVTILGVPKPKKRWFRPLTWLHIIRKVNLLKPDILHFHDPELLFIMPLLRLIHGKRLKLIYDVHEYFIASIKDKFWIPHSLRNRVASCAAIMESFLGRFVDGQVFVVEDQARYYSGWKTQKTVVHNYPDPDDFPPVNQACMQQVPFTIVHIGSLYERRGILTMVEAMRLLKERGAEIKLVLGGAFESMEFRLRLEKIISRYGLEDKVKIVGWVDYTRIKAYLARANATWLPFYPVSQYTQSAVSTKQLEAMLSALPFVCSDLPFLRRYIDEADCGIAVPPKDASAHASAIERLNADRTAAKKMGDRGRCLVMENYNWKNERETLVRFYKRLLGGQKDAGR